MSVEVLIVSMEKACLFTELLNLQADPSYTRISEWKIPERENSSFFQMYE